jgi:alkylated DNA nucleotide flippase Atl1
VFLGIIAVSVLVMASIQVAAIVFAARAARRVGEAMARLEEEMRPIVANLRIVSADAVRISSVAAAQAEQVEQVLTRLRERLDALMQAVQDAIRRIFPWTSWWSRRADPRRRQPTEEEDPLFIG